MSLNEKSLKLSEKEEECINDLEVFIECLKDITAEFNKNPNLNKVQKEDVIFILIFSFLMNTLIWKII
jgi:hypothetical protein